MKPNHNNHYLRWLLAAVLALSAAFTAYSETREETNDYIYVLLDDGSGYGIIQNNVKLVNGHLSLPSYYNGLPIVRVDGIRNDVTSITIPSTVREIKEKAFRNCSLVSIDIPASVVSIGKYAFEQSPKLKQVSIGVSGTATNGPATIGEYAFYNCPNLETVEIGGNVETIDDDAFYMSCVKTVSMAEGVKTIGNSAFSACRSLISVRIPASVTTIGDAAFTGCTALCTVEFVGDTKVDFANPYFGVFSNCSNLESVRLSAGIIELPVNMFYGCGALTSINLPAGLTKIDTKCFQGCSSLPEVVIGDNVTFVGWQAFSCCSGMKKLTIGKSVRKIISNAFYGCTTLEEVHCGGTPAAVYRTEAAIAPGNADIFSPETYEKAVLYVPSKYSGQYKRDDIWGQFAHFYEPSKTVFTEAEGGYAVGYNFDELEATACSGMLVIPDTYNGLPVVAISAGAFKGCSKITGVTIPASVATIGKDAFAGCSGLATVIDLRDTPPTADGAFEFGYSATAYVPFGSLRAYSGASPWSGFHAVVEGIGERTLVQPEFSDDGGDHYDPFMLELTNTNEEAEIYYYIRKGDTDTQVEKYTAPIEIAGDCTVVAYVTDGVHCSDTAERSFAFVERQKLQVTVAGIEVTEKNADNVLGDKGTVSFDIETSTLTLDNAEIASKDYGIVAYNGDLTINVRNNSVINAEAVGIAIGDGPQGGTIGGNLTICGTAAGYTPVLSINMGEKGAMGIEAYLSNVTVENCTLIVTGGNEGIFMKAGGKGDGTLTIGKGSTVNLNTGRSALSGILELNLDETLSILEPENAEFMDGCIVVGKDTQPHVLIGQKLEEVSIPQIEQRTESDYQNDMVDGDGNSLDLENTVVGGVYYNLSGSNGDGYDQKENCLIVNSTMDEKTMKDGNIPATATESYDFSWFSGMVVVVGGTGTISIDCQTIGSSLLVVKIGDGEPEYYTKDERGTVSIDYDTKEPTYIYIYASSTDGKKTESASRVYADKNAVKIYGTAVAPEKVVSGISDIISDDGADSDGVIYDIYGRRCHEPLAPGIYIVNGKKIIK